MSEITGQIEDHNTDQISEAAPLINPTDTQKLRDAYVEARENFLAKKYEVAMDRLVLDKFELFFKSTAAFKGREATGVIEISNRIADFRTQLRDNSDKPIKMSAIEIEASHYFLNKYEGTGLSKAKDYLALLIPIESAMGEVSKDNKMLKELQSQLNASEQGLEAV